MALLKEIEHFGGTEEDLKLLDGVDENSDEELVFSDGEVDRKYRTEVQSFIKDLGLGNGLAKTGKDKKRAKESAVLSKKSPKKEEGSHGTSTSSALEKKLLSLTVRPQKKILVSIDSELLWYDQSNSEAAAHPVGPQALARLGTVGGELMHTEMTLYENVRQKRKSAGDLKWLKTVLSSGTLGDKIAARTLLIQESPVHNLPSLEVLLAMASKKGKRECILAIDALKELWLTVLLPDNRKLKMLKQRPLNELVSPDLSNHSRHSKLLLWYCEDQIKAKYAQFLSIIKGLLHDTVANIREKALGHVFDLLYHKPEQEQELLSQLVNKLGDPVRKIASKASLFLLKLLNQHVNMKVVVATELEKILHRPNIRPKAQYYCICCLNQFTIDVKDDTLAAKLVEIYFTFFKLYVERGELDAKMLGALLTGVNRAFPFLKDDIPSFEDHLKSLFTVVHVGPLATGIQSLLLLYQVMESRQAISGRYYQALYTKLMDPALKHSGKQGIFLNLLFKSVKNDPEMKRVKAFLKRILQVASFHSPPFLCGCLYLISEVLKVRPSLWAFILQPVASDLEHFIDMPLPSETDEPTSSSCDHVTKNTSHMTEAYKIMHRNPLYCGAENSCLWELRQLTQHFHPSVLVFAKKLASGEHVDYKGDPLQDFTAMHFLDRFVYKNPKQRESDHGGSLMQRSSRLMPDPARKEVPVNSTQFAALKPDKVREDEVFMHTYFTQRAALNKEAPDDEKKTKDGDDESGSEMDFAGELEKQATSRRQPNKRSRESASDEESVEDSEIDDDSLVGGASDEVEEMERLLLGNMSSDSDEEPEEGPQRKKQRDPQYSSVEKEEDMSSLFAAAEEFSHLLEDGPSARGGAQPTRKGGAAHEKQLQWEQRNNHRKRKGKGHSETGKGHSGTGKSHSRTGKGHSRTGKRTISHKHSRLRKKK